MSTIGAALDLSTLQKCRPRVMILVLVFTDAGSFLLSTIAALLVCRYLLGTATVGPYTALIATSALSLAMFCALGLYSGLSLGSPEELRRSTLACLSLSAGIMLTSPFVQREHLPSIWSAVLALLFAIAVVPVARECVRQKLCKTEWWGYPAVIFGDERICRSMIRIINSQSSLGLRPVAILCPNGASSTSIDGVPVLEEDGLSDIAPYLGGHGYAVLTSAADASTYFRRISPETRKLLPRVLFVPDTWEFSSLWVSPKNVGALLGLEIREHMYHPGKQLVKRVVDLLVTQLLIMAVAPLLIAIAIAVKIDSAGPILYGHRRIGRGGREFRAWKFRSMVTDADAKLAEHLTAHPELGPEWQMTHKLRCDPRITGIGRWLRRTSLDELPQLWNVLNGEMSLVGPRPIVREEVSKYGKAFDLYTQVPSGLTGLWQVSGRSDTSYEQRVSFDSFYVRNWSVWLDLCILCRTIPTICFRTGAY